jgi:hypothetical protein
LQRDGNETVNGADAQMEVLVAEEGPRDYDRARKRLIPLVDSLGFRVGEAELVPGVERDEDRAGNAFVKSAAVEGKLERNPSIETNRPTTITKKLPDVKIELLSLEEGRVNVCVKTDVVVHNAGAVAGQEDDALANVAEKLSPQKLCDEGKLAKSTAYKQRASLTFVVEDRRRSFPLL